MVIDTASDDPYDTEVRVLSTSFGDNAELSPAERDDVEERITRSLVGLLDRTDLMNAKQITARASASKVLRVVPGRSMSDKTVRATLGPANTNTKPQRLPTVQRVSANEHRLAVAARVAARAAQSTSPALNGSPADVFTAPKEAGNLGQEEAPRRRTKKVSRARIKDAFTTRAERAVYLRAIAFEMEVPAHQPRKSDAGNRKVMLDCGHTMWTSSKGKNGLFCAKCATGLPSDAKERGVKGTDLAATRSEFKDRLEVRSIERLLKASEKPPVPGVDALIKPATLYRKTVQPHRSVVTLISRPADPETGKAPRGKLAYLSCGHYVAVDANTKGVTRHACAKCEAHTPPEPPPASLPKAELMEMLAAARARDEKLNLLPPDRPRYKGTAPGSASRVSSR